MNVVTMTTRHLLELHMEVRDRDVWSQLKCLRPSPSQDTVVNIGFFVGQAALTLSTPERGSASLADAVDTSSDL